MSNSLNRNMKNYSVLTAVNTLDDAWDLGARALSDCVEGSWRD
jgi:lipoate synthase